MPEAGNETKPARRRQLPAQLAGGSASPVSRLELRLSNTRYRAHTMTTPGKSMLAIGPGRIARSAPSFARARGSDVRVTATERPADDQCSCARVSHRGRGLLMILLAGSLAANACGAPAAKDAPLFGTGVFHPPPKPGGSISQTRMCECQVCDPASCCDGPEDEPAPAECSNGYDFSSCGGKVSSCVSRCTRQVWRVRASVACEEKRPPSCCHAG